MFSYFCFPMIWLTGTEGVAPHFCQPIFGQCDLTKDIENNQRKQREKSITMKKQRDNKRNY